MNRPITVTLPGDLAEMIEGKVASGEYADASEIVRDGLRALQAQDLAVESWLREDVAATYDLNRADPSRAIPADRLLGRLEDMFAAKREQERGGDDA